MNWRKIYRRVLSNIHGIIYYFFVGMHQADKKIVTNNGSGEISRDGSAIEVQEEAQNVYNDLLRGEVTERVKELRHEMYYSERKSYDYEYNGNGRVKLKKNNFFSFNGSAENSDNHEIEIVQDNKEDPSSLMDFGIYAMGDDVSIDKKILGDVAVKNKREFTISIERNFLPQFRIEEYANKIIIKKIDDNKKIIDIYISEMPIEFNRRSRIFINELNRLYNGDKRSEIIDFNNLEFISFKAFGTKDLIKYKFNNISFIEIIKFDGNFVLRFNAELLSKEDIISEFYNQLTEDKSNSHSPREGYKKIAYFAEKSENENYNIEKAIELTNSLKN